MTARSARLSIRILRLLRRTCTESDRYVGVGYWPSMQTFAARLAAKHGRSLDVVAGVISALSPNNLWRTNAAAAARVLSGERAGVPAYGRDVRKAVAILEGAEPETVLLGLKTRSFYRLIRDGGNEVDVCVDGHILNLVAGRRGRRLNAVGRISPRDYEEIADAFRIAARHCTTDGYWTQPCQIQAALWLSWRASQGFRQRRIA